MVFLQPEPPFSLMDKCHCGLFSSAHFCLTKLTVDGPLKVSSPLGTTLVCDASF